MDPSPIRSFRAFWQASTNTGRIILQLEDGANVPIKLDSPQELSAMTAMLRDNYCYWDATDQLLMTAWRATGK